MARLRHRLALAFALALALASLPTLAGCTDEHACGSITRRCLNGTTIEICLDGGDPSIDGVSNHTCPTSAPVCATTASGDDAVCALRATPEPACAAQANPASICDGGRKLRCDAGFATSEETCSGTCFVGSSGPTCALSATPDPLCAGSLTTPDHRSSVCRDLSTRLDCEFGFVVATRSCVAPGRCETTTPLTGPIGLCVLGSAPDPRCRPDEVTSREHCIIGGAITCRAGWVVQELLCKGESLCSSIGPTSCPRGVLSQIGTPRGL